MSRRTRSRGGATAILLALLAITPLVVVDGCARAGRARSHGDPADAAQEEGDERVTLVVRNENFANLDVRVIRNGGSVRLGVVTANTTRRFLLDATPAPDLNVTATPLGGGTGASSGPIAVLPGQTIDFWIGMRLWQTSVFVR